MADASSVSRQAAIATATISRTLEVGSPANQMEALLTAYRMASDRDAFVLALIGDLVGRAQ